MVTRKKTDVVQLSKIRMREELRRRLAREAERKGTTLNAEIVERLEQSFAREAHTMRDTAIIDLMVSERWGHLASVLRTNPDLLKLDAQAAMKSFVKDASTAGRNEPDKEPEAGGDK
jgi:Arc-like DNA binding domain